MKKIILIILILTTIDLLAAEVSPNPAKNPPKDQDTLVCLTAPKPTPEDHKKFIDFMWLKKSGSALMQMQLFEKVLLPPQKISSRIRQDAPQIGISNIDINEDNLIEENPKHD